MLPFDRRLYRAMFHSTRWLGTPALRSVTTRLYYRIYIQDIQEKDIIA